MTVPTLDYDHPEPPSPLRFLRYASKCACWGFLVPFLGLFGIGFGVAAATQNGLSPTQRKLGLGWAGVGVFSTLINPLMCIGLLLPSLGQARPEANVIKCASNLRHIGLAIHMYANDNRDALCTDIVTLLSTQDLTTDAFICAQSEHDDTIPGGGPTSVIEGTSTCSYLFYRFPNQKLGQLPPDAILVFEKECFHTLRTRA